MGNNMLTASLTIPAGNVALAGDLVLPTNAGGIVLFVHGSGSSRHSSRNQYVASVLQSAGTGTLLFDLLTEEEEAIDLRTRHLRFDINLLAQRLVEVTRWMQQQPQTSHLKVGYFGASTGGGAALVAAATLGNQISAVVSRGGRPDLAGEALARVSTPTLLLVGGWDAPVIGMNRDAYEQLHCEKAMKVIPAASHLFEEPGKLEEVAQLSAEWFLHYMPPRS
jgi:putative phosphoribosyl transferase